MQTHEYFSEKYLNQIKTFIQNNPDIERKNVGLVREPQENTVWVGDWGHKPQCSYCGKEMAEGTIVKKGNTCGYPVWFCINRYCDGYRLTNMRLQKEKYEYNESHTGNDYLDMICEKMNIPKNFKNKTLSILSSQNITKVKNIIKNKDNLCITGETGTGKTHIAVALLLEFGKQKPNISRFENVGMLFNKITSDIKENLNYTKIIDSLCNYELLVIDDIGSIKNSEHRKEILFMILEGRNFNNKQTIITSNLSVQEISDLFDERIASRLSEYKQFEMVGKDHRRK